MTLDQYLEDLEAVADWKAELQTKISRAQLRFNTVGYSVEELEGLIAEGEDFKSVCRSMAENLKGELCD